jgi:hypothetical protein
MVLLQTHTAKRFKQPSQESVHKNAEDKKNRLKHSRERWRTNSPDFNQDTLAEFTIGPMPLLENRRTRVSELIHILISTKNHTIWLDLCATKEIIQPKTESTII